MATLSCRSPAVWLPASSIVVERHGSGVSGPGAGRRPGTPRGRRLRAGFAAVQLALSLALLIGAMLMVATLRGLSAVDPGFRADGVSVHYIDLASQGYTRRVRCSTCATSRPACRPSPGVTAAFSYSYPFGSAFMQQVQAPTGARAIRSGVYERRQRSLLRRTRHTNRQRPGIHRARGDGIRERQRQRGPHRPIARPATLRRRRSARATIVVPGKNAETLLVVGVAGDVRTDLVTGEPELSLYQPFARISVFVSRPTVLVKSALTIRAASETVRAVAARIDPTVPISGNQPLRTQTIDRRLSSQRVFAWVLSLLGGLGFVLAAVGLYGLLAQAVTERAREFGIRMALGATRGQVYGLVLRHAALVAVIGGIAGIGLALLGTRVIEAQLWGVAAHDPSIYAAAVLALLVVVFIAAAWPARLATLVEPVEALRAD